MRKKVKKVKRKGGGENQRKVRNGKKGKNMRKEVRG